MVDPTAQPIPPDHRRISLDLRLLVGLLLVVISAMLLIWKPWEGTSSSARTITVTGDTKLTAEPDQYIFSPSYNFQNSNRATALAALTQKSDELLAKLKSLGVPPSQLKTNAGGFEANTYPIAQSGSTYTLQLTVTVSDHSLAQKVQDYLVTTTPTGAVSPQADFSQTKRKSLESKARDQATKEAQQKALQSAKNLGFRLGRVKSVTDGAGFGIVPLGLDDQAKAGASSLAVQPGENDLNYSVQVVYFIH